MGIGIFKKMKNAFKSVGNTIKNVATKVGKALPKVVEVGKRVTNAVKPVLGEIPLIGDAVRAIDTGLNYANKGLKIGKSLIDEVA